MHSALRPLTPRHAAAAARATGRQITAAIPARGASTDGRGRRLTVWGAFAACVIAVIVESGLLFGAAFVLALGVILVSPPERLIAIGPDGLVLLCRHHLRWTWSWSVVAPADFHPLSPCSERWVVGSEHVTVERPDVLHDWAERLGYPAPIVVDLERSWLRPLLGVVVVVAFLIDPAFVLSRDGSWQQVFRSILQITLFAVAIAIDQWPRRVCILQAGERWELWERGVRRNAQARLVSADVVPFPRRGAANVVAIGKVAYRIAPCWSALFPEPDEAVLARRF